MFFYIILVLKIYKCKGKKELFNIDKNHSQNSHVIFHLMMNVQAKIILKRPYNSFKS